MTHVDPITNEVIDLNIFQRINKVQGEVDYIQKEKKAGMKYSIVSHDAVTAKVRPLMVKWGVVYYPINMVMTQDGDRTQMTCDVRFVNIDNDEQYFDVATAGYGIDNQDKGPGKAISYCVKYALLKCLGLESGDDPDEDQVTTHTPAAVIDFTKRLDLCMSLDDLNVVMGDIARTAGTLAPGPLQLLRQKAAKRKLELGTPG